MELSGAMIIFPRDEENISLFFRPVLFDRAALWLSEDLRRLGAGRFLVVCDEAWFDRARPCFPEDTVFVSPEAKDLAVRLDDFLAACPGPVAAVRQSVLVAPKGTHFFLPDREDRSSAKAVLTVRGAALAAALKEGTPLEKAVTALGDAKPWAERVLPVTPGLLAHGHVQSMAKGMETDRLIEAGVDILDPDSTYISPTVTVGEGTTLLPGTILRGRTVIGKGCTIGPNSMIRDCVIGEGVTVNASQLNESTVDDGATVGPFAYVRPNCKIGKGVRVGDFVELKNSTIGDGTKISHLTYVGDTDAGEHINFGCGTVTVNYDGTQKFRTTIGDHAFIGCNTNLVAPVTVGKGAYTAAGSTITDDVPPDSLAIARERQSVKKNWAKKRRSK